MGAEKGHRLIADFDACMDRRYAGSAHELHVQRLDRQLSEQADAKVVPPWVAMMMRVVSFQRLDRLIPAIVDFHHQQHVRGRRPDRSAETARSSGYPCGRWPT